MQQSQAALIFAAITLAASPALADVTVTPAAGESFRVNGPVVLPAVPGAGQQAQALCIGAGGQLGPCAASPGGGVTAGTGVSVNNGVVSIAPGYQLPQSCTGSQAIQWNGSAWVCVSPVSTGSLPACQVGEVLRFGVGGLECGTTPHSFAQVPALLPTNMGAGDYPSIAIGSDGLPVIAYQGGFNSTSSGLWNELRLFKCADRACTTGRDYAMDYSGGDTGLYTSIAIGLDGLPVISYRDGTNNTLKVVKCGTVECSSGTIAARTTVDATGNVGIYSSIAIGGDGMPVVSHYDGTGQNLKFIRCTTPDCAGGTISNTVDSAGVVGTYSAVAVPADGLPIISYYDGTNGHLKIAKCGNLNCSTSTRRTVDDTTGATGRYGRIAIGLDGLPVIAYLDGQTGGLKVAHCHDQDCASTTRTVVRAGIGVISHISIAMGAGGLAISYTAPNLAQLEIATCHNPACTSATVSVVDVPVVGGVDTAAAVGADGLPVIVYRPAYGPLKAVQCSTATCRKP